MGEAGAEGMGLHGGGVSARERALGGRAAEGGEVARPGAGVRSRGALCHFLGGRRRRGGVSVAGQRGGVSELWGVSAWPAVQRGWCVRGDPCEGVLWGWETSPVP